MKSVWHDGKTRVHALKCVSCGTETEEHRNKTDYIELRHFDRSFDNIPGIGGSYERFMKAVTDLNRETTNEAFDAEIWAAVQIRTGVGDDNYVVAAYSDLPEEGKGTGPDQDLPFAHPDVSWSARAVVVNDAPFKMVDVNDGSAWVYLEHVPSIDIENQGNLIRIRT